MLKRLFCFATVLCANAAWAEVDLAGMWVNKSNQEYYEHIYGPSLGDYMGVPLNAEGRAASFSYIGNKDEELQRQCAPWLQQYLMFASGFPIRIWSTPDPITGKVIAWTIGGNAVDRLSLTIWIDGRQPPPPQALHTYSGFATGKWEGNTLVANVTHLKDGLLDRNGLPASNQTTMKLFVTRHDEILTITAIIKDPIYLEAPLVLAQSWQIDHTASTDTTPVYCIPAETLSELADGYHVIHVLPWHSTAPKNMQETYGIPREAAMGGAETMYPEFRKQLDLKYKPPTKYCTIGCCDVNMLDPSTAVCKSLN